VTSSAGRRPAGDVVSGPENISGIPFDFRAGACILQLTAERTADETATRKRENEMTVMTDTTGKDHEIHAIGNVVTLRKIGWTVKAVTTETTVKVAKVPTPETEWDAVFGRR
jgi:hypothetical protein